MSLKARFEELSERWSAALWRLTGVYAKSAADREDLHQEILLQLWRALPAFRGEATERTWLYRIAHNVAITWQVRNRARSSRSEPITGDIGAPASGDRTRRLALQQLISRLPVIDRQLVTLWLEGLTAAEMEAVSGIRAGTVAVRLTRLRQQLAAAMNAEVQP